MKWLLIVVAIGSLTSLGSGRSDGGTRIGDRLERALQAAPSTQELLVWVHFTDKGRRELQKTSVPHDVVSERSLQRRLKVLPADRTVDYDDLPVEQHYVDQVAAHVTGVRHVSRWFNSASVIATPTQIAILGQFPFVKEIELVARLRRAQEAEQTRTHDEPDLKAARKMLQPGELDYGPSLPQVSLINVPAIHATGNHGQGVLIGVFDNGFRLLTHEAFDSLQSRILATRDFVDHKESVVPVNPSLDFGSHGVSVLSIIGGYKPGRIIGPAFGATYILARTENDSSETPIEEDNWAAAVEWAESLGVDITSTSLSYLGDYTPPYAGYTWQDMNGRTTIISRAAAMAVRRGVIVVNGAGNDGDNPTRNTLNAPADADSVLAVGAVDAYGVRASFSSVGPSTSTPPRIKPDVMAQGSGNHVAGAVNRTGYTTGGGTSFSCPLAAGVAALLLREFPSATPMQIVSALKNTASRAGSPGNRYGWGIIDAVAAMQYLASWGPQPTSYALSQNFPNPFNPSTRIWYALPEPSTVSVTVYNILGQQVRTLVSTALPNGTHEVSWNGRNDDGAQVSSGVYIYRLEAVGASGSSTSITKKMILVR